MWRPGIQIIRTLRPLIVKAIQKIPVKSSFKARLNKLAKSIYWSLDKGDKADLQDGDKADLQNHIIFVEIDTALQNWSKPEKQRETRALTNWLSRTSKIPSTDLNVFLFGLNNQLKLLKNINDAVEGLDTKINPEKASTERLRALSLKEKHHIEELGTVLTNCLLEDQPSKYREDLLRSLGVKGVDRLIKRHRSSVIPGAKSIFFENFETTAQHEQNHILMPVISSLPNDGRVFRTAHWLCERGYRVTIIAPKIWSDEVSLPNNSYGGKLTIQLLEPDDSIFSEPEVFWAPLLNQMFLHRPYAIHCHDIHPVIASIICARILDVKLVVDLHELRSENVTYDQVSSRWVPHSRARKNVFENIELLSFTFADEVISVSSGVIQILKKKYGPRNVRLLRNVPTAEQKEFQGKSVRELIRAKRNDFVILYQGGLGELRNLHPVIKAMEYLGQHVKLVIRGPGATTEVSSSYHNLTKQLGLSKQVFFLEGVPSEEVVGSMEGADIGLCTLTDIALSFVHSLNNKNFEYLLAGIPQIVADYPDMREFVIGHNIGVTFDPNSPKSFAKAIESLCENPKEFERYRKNAIKLSAANPYKREWDELKNIYPGNSTIKKSKLTK